MKNQRKIKTNGPCENEEQSQQDNKCQFTLYHTNPAMRPSASMNDIYLTRDHPLVVYFKRASFLIKSSECQLIKIHGLGSCIVPSVRLVQDLLSNFFPLIEIQETQTFSMAVVDDGKKANNQVLFHLLLSKMVK